MKQIIRVLALILAVLTLDGCGQTEKSHNLPNRTVVFSFITIGKGDAFLLTSPEGEQYLIDTGKQSDFLQIARFLRIKGVNSLDGIFLSHGHLDHVGSLKALLTTFSVKKIYLSAVDTVSYREIDAVALAMAHNISVEKLSAGDVLTSGEMCIRCWTPKKVITNNENNNSVVLRVTYGKTAFLLMGDAELEEESILLDSDEDLRANVLKLGHHGEDDATSLALLKKVKPQYGLITGNLEENPDSQNPAVAARLSSVGAKPIYSEINGLGIDFISDGNQIITKTVSDQAFPTDSTLTLLDFDRKNQRITVKNTGDTSISLDGYMLFSKRGETFGFPKNTCLTSGKSITVSCRNTWREGDLLWDEEKIWEKNDSACLYDSNFTLLDEQTDMEEKSWKNSIKQ